jgi:hypothetical protein
VLATLMRRPWPQLTSLQLLPGAGSSAQPLLLPTLQLVCSLPALRDLQLACALADAPGCSTAAAAASQQVQQRALALVAAAPALEALSWPSCQAAALDLAPASRLRALDLKDLPDLCHVSTACPALTRLELVNAGRGAALDIGPLSSLTALAHLRVFSKAVAGWAAALPALPRLQHLQGYDQPVQQLPRLPALTELRLHVAEAAGGDLHHLAQQLPSLQVMQHGARCSARSTPGTLPHVPSPTLPLSSPTPAPTPTSTRPPAQVLHLVGAWNAPGRLGASLAPADLGAVFSHVSSLEIARVQLNRLEPSFAAMFPRLHTWKVDYKGDDGPNRSRRPLDPAGESDWEDLSAYIVPEDPRATSYPPPPRLSDSRQLARCMGGMACLASFTDHSRQGYSAADWDVLAALPALRHLERYIDVTTRRPGRPLSDRAQPARAAAEQQVSRVTALTHLHIMAADGRAPAAPDFGAYITHALAHLPALGRLSLDIDWTRAAGSAAEHQLAMWQAVAALPRLARIDLAELFEFDQDHMSALAAGPAVTHIHSLGSAFVAEHLHAWLRQLEAVHAHKELRVTNVHCLC